MALTIGWSERGVVCVCLFARVASNRWRLGDGLRTCVEYMCSAACAESAEDVRVACVGSAEGKRAEGGGSGGEMGLVLDDMFLFFGRGFWEFGWMMT